VTNIGHGYFRGTECGYLIRIPYVYGNNPEFVTTYSLSKMIDPQQSENTAPK